MRLDDALEICREMDGVRPKPDACTMASLLLPAVTNTLPENVLYVRDVCEFGEEKFGLMECKDKCIYEKLNAWKICRSIFTNGEM